LGQLQEKWIQAVDDYRFPVVTLSDRTGADAVCTIFETLNRTGVKLSPFELLTARFWPKSVDLRALWAKARDDDPLIAEFDIDPYYLLQAIALVSRKTPSCKRSDVLGLSADDIVAWWPRAAAGIGASLRILRDECGVIIPKWLPYNTILIPMAAVLAKQDKPTGPEAGAKRERLVRWFWCSVFGQAYENAPNSQAAKDVVDLGVWLEGGDPPETVRNFQFDPRQLHHTTYRQRALYRGTIALILRGGPRDFYSGEPLTRDLMIEHLVDDHHVFPYGYLKSGRADYQHRSDCVLNRTLIDRKTNIRISDQCPSKYMEGIRNALGEASFGQLLSSHHLPSGPGSPFWANDFESFLRWREEALWEEIKRATGATHGSDLIEEEPA
jgi:hypothetical protein